MSKVLLAQACLDERGQITGGTPGDQTKREVRIDEWYDGNWTHVLRCPDNEAAKRIAEMAEKICNNDKVGYDQADRYGLYVALKQKNGDVDAIDVDCNCDCSSLATCCAIFNGYNISRFTYTGSIRQQLMSVGWSALSFSRFLNSSDYLKKGDMLLCEGKHVAIVLNDGEKSNDNSGEDASAPSKAPKWVGVVTTTLNVRTGAGTTYPNYSEWPLLGESNLVDVCDEKTVNDVKWYYIRIAGVHFAWACGDFIIPVNGQKAYAPWVGKVTTLLNVRKGPSVLYAKLPEWPQLGQGNLVRVDGEEKGGWLKINICNEHTPAGGFTGYVNGKYLEKV